MLLRLVFGNLEWLGLGTVDVSEAVLARQFANRQKLPALGHHLGVAGKCGYCTSEVLRRFVAAQVPWRERDRGHSVWTQLFGEPERHPCRRRLGGVVEHISEIGAECPCDC